jgi:hypothetical protein
MRLKKSRNAVRIASEPLPSAPSTPEAFPDESQRLVLVPAQEMTPENAPKSCDFNNFLVIVPAKPSAISNLQKAWCRVADAAKRTTRRTKSKRLCRISPSVSIKYKQNGRPSGKPSDWNTSAIRRVPFRGVQPRSVGTPIGSTTAIPKRQLGLVNGAPGVHK